MPDLGAARRAADVAVVEERLPEERVESRVRARAERMRRRRGMTLRRPSRDAAAPRGEICVEPRGKRLAPPRRVAARAGEPPNRGAQRDAAVRRVEHLAARRDVTRPNEARDIAACGEMRQVRPPFVRQRVVRPFAVQEQARLGRDASGKGDRCGVRRRILDGLRRADRHAIPRRDGHLVVAHVVANRHPEMGSHEARAAPFGVRNQPIVDARHRLQKEIAASLAQNIPRRRRKRRRVDAAAHEDGGAAGPHAVAHRALQQLGEAVGIVCGAPEMDRRVHRQRPVSPRPRRVGRPRDRVRRGDASDVAEHRGAAFPIRAEKQEVRDRGLVELAGNRRVPANAVERVADDDRVADPRIEQRLHAEMIARAEQAAARRIPDDEREIADEMRGAVLAPLAVGARDQFHIRRRVCASMRRARAQRRGEIRSRVDPRVGDHPCAAVVGIGLIVERRFVVHAQQRVTEARVADHSDGAAIRSTKRQGVREAAEKSGVERRAVEVHDRDDAAHERCGVSRARAPGLRRRARRRRGLRRGRPPADRASSGTRSA